MLNETVSSGGNYRWRICALVFVATTINYLDRQVISLLKDDYLAPLYKWTESDYANIVIAFQLAYAIGMIGIFYSLTMWCIGLAYQNVDVRAVAAAHVSAP